MVEKDVQVKVPGYSGFDKTHRVSQTLTCGTITPILCDEVIPGEKVNLKLDLAAQLPPLVSDTYMNVKLKAEAFFVPSRILCRSYESFFSDVSQKVSIYDQVADSHTLFDIKGVLPYFNMGTTGFTALKAAHFMGPGSLADYLGFSPNTFTWSGATCKFTLLPFLAYHLIYQEWYRNPRVQNPCFAPEYRVLSSTTASKAPIYSAPFTFYHGSALTVANATVAANNKYEFSNDIADFALADGHNLFDLRQRNFGFDMYTSAQLTPQQGTAAKVTVDTPSGQDATFTISALRAMNSLQQFNERNNIPSSRMVDQVYARYGTRMSDGVAQRPLCLGSAEYDIYSKGVDQTNANTDQVQDNPFNSVGTQYGRAYAAGSDFIIDNFESKEPGYLIVNVTLVPVVSYGFGIDPMFMRYVNDGSITDMANPILQNVGPEPIYSQEISTDIVPGLSAVFGYRDRYGSFKDKVSRVRGLLHTAESLSSFVLQREIASNAVLSSSFLEIPKTFLDTVFVSNQSISGFSCWLDAMVGLKVAMPLAKYSIPSLQDPAYEHGRTISLRKNGQIF